MSPLDGSKGKDTYRTHRVFCCLSYSKNTAVRWQFPLELFILCGNFHIREFNFCSRTEKSLAVISISSFVPGALQHPKLPLHDSSRGDPSPSLDTAAPPVCSPPTPVSPQSSRRLAVGPPPHSHLTAAALPLPGSHPTAFVRTSRRRGATAAPPPHRCLCTVTARSLCRRRPVAFPPLPGRRCGVASEPWRSHRAPASRRPRCRQPENLTAVATLPHTCLCVGERHRLRSGTPKSQAGPAQLQFTCQRTLVRQ